MNYDLNKCLPFIMKKPSIHTDHRHPYNSREERSETHAYVQVRIVALYYGYLRWHEMFNIIGPCGLMDRALNSRSKGLGLMSTAGHVQKCWTNFSCYAATLHPAVICSWLAQIVFEWLKLHEYLHTWYNGYAVFSQDDSSNKQPKWSKTMLANICMQVCVNVNINSLT